MLSPPLIANARFLELEIAWFQRCLNHRFHLHTVGNETTTEERDLFAVNPPPHLAKHQGPYTDILRQFAFNPPERLVLMLAFLPCVRHELLDPFLIKNHAIDARFTEFGGIHSAPGGGFQPTLQTALFMLAGARLSDRLLFLALFQPQHSFFRAGILRRATEEISASPLGRPLQLSHEYQLRLTSGADYAPPLSAEFPAERLHTAFEWPDLVVETETRRGLEDINHWIRYRPFLLNEWKLSGRIRSGYRSLFYGPPGTGKSLSAALLGKTTGLPVYRVDLSRIVSKYIGETEKNLASLFDQAELQQWILFFDEADSLFGRRTDTHNANDRAANQQVSYLLQRIEDFPGVVLLATNLRAHIDDAFARRFQSILHFPIPSVEQRTRLWKDNFEDKPYTLAPNIDLAALAREHELSGGAILNVLRFACLRAVARSNSRIEVSDLVLGIRNELQKEGRFITHK